MALGKTSSSQYNGCDSNSSSICASSFLRKWREDKAALLDKMDGEEKEEIEEWRERAKKELNDWYERRDEQLGKTQASNR